jgi:metallo-beta-lactamase class B
MLHDPVHIKGSCSFLFTVKDAKRSYKILIANMPSIVIDKKFTEVTAYPEIERDYANTFKAMKNLSFDIWLSSHCSQFGMHTKHKPGDAYNPTAFIDRRGYDKTLSNLEAEFLKKKKQSER